MQSPFIGVPAATPVVAFDDLASTNSEALALLARGETGPLWISARRQSGGRGRMGRSWQGAPGNLHASILLTLPWELRDLPSLSLVAGVALAEAAAGIGTSRPDAPANARPKLKWPNDLMIGEAKCAGILVESGPSAGGCHGAVLGFGVNVSAAPDVDDRAVTCFLAHGIETEPEVFRQLIDGALRELFSILNTPDGFSRVREMWLSHAPQIGTALSVRSGDSRLTGQFAGLGADGTLLLEDEDGQVKSISYGDVSASGGVV